MFLGWRNRSTITILKELTLRGEKTGDWGACEFYFFAGKAVRHLQAATQAGNHTVIRENGVFLIGAG